MLTTKILIKKTLELNDLYSNGLKELAKIHSISPDVVKNILEDPNYITSIDNEEFKKELRKLAEKHDAFMTSILYEVWDVKDLGFGVLSSLASYLETLEPDQIRSLSCKKLSDIILFLNLETRIKFAPEEVSSEKKEFFEKFSASILKGIRPN